MPSSREDILAALTCSSSLDGCDGDWRREVLDDADPDDLAFIQNQIGQNGETDKETFTRLSKGGKL